MMQERQLLEVDPLFNDLFFEIPQQTFTLEDLKGLVKFPLPVSAQGFNAFQFSPDGVNFRLGFCDILKQLNDFLGANDQVITANLNLFVKQYINNDGRDIGFTEICMPLYQQGILFLAGILQIVKNENIPLAIRKTGVKNLFTQLNVCPPGIYTHISDTYLRLASFLEVKNYFMSYRAEMARQLISEKILKLRPNIYEGNDIHYSNAVINLYDDALGLQRIEDLLVRGCCDAAALEELSALFAADIGKHITVDNLFDQIINELNLQEWTSELMSFLAKNNLNAYNDSIKLLGDKLLRFGQGEIAVDKLFVTNDMAEIKGVSLNAEYVLYVNLFERMAANGYVSGRAFELVGEDKEIKAFYIPLRTLKFAYIETKMGKQPFLPFFADALMNESSAMNKLDEIITDHPEMHHEVIDYIVRYLNSADVAPEQYDSDGIRNLLFYLAVAFPKHWSVIIKRLSPVFRPVFLAQLLTDIDNVNLAKEVRALYFSGKTMQGDRLVDVLLGYAAPLSELAADGMALIHAASRGNFLYITQELVRLKVDVNMRDGGGATALMHACVSGSMPLVNFLLEHGANVQLATKGLDTALHVASWYGQPAAANKLLEMGANPNFTNARGLTPLHCACINGNVEIIKSLLAKGANIEARTHEGVSPLSFAVNNGKNDAALALLRAGALPDLPKKKCMELLQTLIDNNEHQVTEKMLKRLLVRYMSEISERKIRQPESKGSSPDEVMLNQLELREKKSIHASKIYASSLLFSVLNADGSDAGKIERFGIFKHDVAAAARHSKRFNLFVRAFQKLNGNQELSVEPVQVVRNKL